MIHYPYHNNSKQLYWSNKLMITSQLYLPNQHPTIDNSKPKTQSPSSYKKWRISKLKKEGMIMTSWWIRVRWSRLTLRLLVAVVMRGKGVLSNKETEPTWSHKPPTQSSRWVIMRKSQRAVRIGRERVKKRWIEERPEGHSCKGSSKMKGTPSLSFPLYY